MMDEIFEMWSLNNRKYLGERLETYNREELALIVAAMFEIFVPNDKYKNVLDEVEKVIKNDGIENIGKV